MIKRYKLNPGGASGTPCYFDGNDTSTSSNPSFYQGTVNIVGAADAVVTIQVTTYLNTNSGGALKVNSSPKVLNDVFTVILNGSGNGSFVVRLEGNASDTGTLIRGIFTITGVDVGQIGSPATHQESKVF